jgi:hypothetical protein
MASREENGGSPSSVFQPEDIALMNSVLDEAATVLPVARRTSAMKARLASRILASAPKVNEIQFGRGLRRFSGPLTIEVCDVSSDLHHDLNGLQITVRVVFSCAFTLLAALAAYFAIRWMAGVYS